MPAAAPVAPSEPRSSQVHPPDVALPGFAELQETLAQMKELQAHAHDPRELERRVQGMEQDPQKLAKLRAIADMFVQLPPSRGEGYLPAGNSSAPAR